MTFSGDKNQLQYFPPQRFITTTQLQGRVLHKQGEPSDAPQRDDGAGRDEE